MKSAFESNTSVLGSLEVNNSEFNNDLMGGVREVLSDIDEQLKLIGDAIRKIETNNGELANIATKLFDRINGLSDEFAEIKREIKDETLDIDGFVKLTGELENVKII